MTESVCDAQRRALEAGIGVINAADLCARSGPAVLRVQSTIERCFGRDGLGIVLVDGLADWYHEVRSDLMTAARAFARLADAERAPYEIPAVEYAVGWSHGREKFRGRTDTCKGSFYANPVFDEPADGDAARLQSYPHIMTSNVWPHGHGKEVANLEPAFKKIGKYINALGIDLAWHCDRYVEHVRNNTTDAGGARITFTALHDSLQASRSQKGRLLHYFPVQVDRLVGENEDGIWCGFHNDHGTITGLVAGEYYDEQTGSVLARSPDARAGLHICPLDREQPTAAPIGAKCLAFQIGETAQIMSGGLLRAGPHAVIAPRGGAADSSSHLVCRSTLAVFLQPNPEEVLRVPKWDEGQTEALKTSPLVPSLAGRFSDGDTFASFCARTFHAYVVP